MKKVCIFLSVLILMSLILLTACSSGSGLSNDYYSRNSEMPEIESESKITDVANTLTTARADMVYTSSENNDVIVKKVIKNASLSMETYEVKKAYQMFLNYVKTHGGYEFSRNLQENGDYISVDAVIKIKPEALDDLLDYAGECGEIKYSNVSSDDVTSQYYDIETRLENKRRNLDKYYEYLASAKTVEEMIKLQNEIDRITEEIESYEGQLKLWNTLVGESTVSLRIYQKNDPYAEAAEPVDWSSMTAEKMGTLMLNGFKSVCNVILAVLQWLIIILFSASPFIIILGILIFVIFKVFKAKNKKAVEARSANAIEDIERAVNGDGENNGKDNE